MAEIIPFVPTLTCRGKERIGDGRTWQIWFNRPLTRAESINLWLLLRTTPLSPICPPGYEPSDKDDPDAWEDA